MRVEEIVNLASNPLAETKNCVMQNIYVELNLRNFS